MTFLETWTLITNNATWSPRSHHIMEALPGNAGVIIAGGSTPKNDTNDVFFAQGLVFLADTTSSTSATSMASTTGGATGATTGTVGAAGAIQVMWMLVGLLVAILV